MKKTKMGPKYKQIKEDIVEDILSGIYEPGDMIPKQSEYAERYNVSRLTVRKAIDDLVMKGILQTEKGKGTFVQDIATKAYSYRRVAGLSSNVISKKIKVHSRVISIESIKADRSLASHLQIREGDEVIKIERLRYVNEICISFQKSFMAAARVGDIDFEAADLNENSLYEVLNEQVNISMSFVDERFRAIRATEEISRYFGVEEGDPILYVNRVTYDSNHVPIEYCRNYESSDVNGIWVKSISIE